MGILTIQYCIKPEIARTSKSRVISDPALVVSAMVDQEAYSWFGVY